MLASLLLAYCCLVFWPSVWNIILSSVMPRYRSEHKYVHSLLMHAGLIRCTWDPHPSGGCRHMCVWICIRILFGTCLHKAFSYYYPSTLTKLQWLPNIYLCFLLPLIRSYLWFDWKTYLVLCVILIICSFWYEDVAEFMYLLFHISVPLCFPACDA